MFKNMPAFSGFSVHDIQEATKFYREVLGLKTMHPMDQLELHLAGGGKVFVYSKPNHVPATFTVLNFKVPDVENAVDAFMVKGVKFEIYNTGDLKTDNKGIMRGRGPAIAWFKDPSGNFLSVVEDNDTGI